MLKIKDATGKVVGILRDEDSSPEMEELEVSKETEEEEEEEEKEDANSEA